MTYTETFTRNCLYKVVIKNLLFILKGNVDSAEMIRTFNCGIGFVLITSAQHQSAVLQRLAADGETDARVIGSVVNMGNVTRIFCDSTARCQMFLFCKSVGWRDPSFGV